MATSTGVPEAIAILLREHVAGYEVIDALIEAVDAAGTTDHDGIARAFGEAERALAYFEGPLEGHIEREEGPLFPLLKAAMPPGDRLIDEMVAEHDLIRMKRDEVREAILAVLNDDHHGVREDVRRLRARVDDPVREAHSIAALQHAARAIAEKMRVHFENEEELVFPLAPELLDPATLDRVRDEILAIDPRTDA